MITLIWSNWYVHIDMITSIWSDWYDHIDMITSNLYMLGGSVSIKLSWRLFLVESTTIMRNDMLCFASSKGVNDLIMSLNLQMQLPRFITYTNTVDMIISLMWIYHLCDHIIDMIISMTWVLDFSCFCDHVIIFNLSYSLAYDRRLPYAREVIIQVRGG